MEETKFSVKGIINKLKEYAETYKDLAYLKFVGKISKLSSGLLLTLIFLLLILFVGFYLSMAFAFFIGELLNSYALGFAITGLLFILVILLTIAFRKNIQGAFGNFFIRLFVQLRNDDDDDEAQD